MTEYSPVPPVLLDSFARNGRVNAALFAALTPEDLDLDDGRGGWPIRQHLAHLANFRKGWLTNISPAHVQGLAEVYEAIPNPGAGPGYRILLRELEPLSAACAAGDEAALRAVQDAVEAGREFDDPWKEGTYQSHPAQFLQHIIVHDSHHRGQIMALLRMNGRTGEQMDALEEATWPIWRE